MCTFAMQFRNDDANKLGYGVMVTLQILVLSFLVRVRVSQHKVGCIAKMHPVFLFPMVVSEWRFTGSLEFLCRLVLIQKQWFQSCIGVVGFC